MRSYRRLAAVSVIIMLTISLLSSCASGKQDPEPSADVPVLKDRSLIHEPEFGGIYITATIEEFNSLGFEYGDSVDIVLSNGFTLEDIPYYNGYYVDPGEALLIAYPGYDYIKAAINFGEDLWNRAGLLTANLKAEISQNDLWLTAERSNDPLSEDSTGSVFLRQKAKYLDVQNARDIHYSDDRTKFPSDAVFANFRSIDAGSIGPGVLYRSASPCDDQHSRARYSDALMGEAGVSCILNLCDDYVRLDSYVSRPGFDSPNFLELYRTDRVIPLALNANYTSEEFAARVASGLIEMTEKGGPFLVHCTEGKDRTGFVCMLIEALAGATYQEMADDYMITYDNYYEISKTKQTDKYYVILEKNFDTMLQFLAGSPSVDITNADMSIYARNYLRHVGMTDEEMDALLDVLR